MLREFFANMAILDKQVLFKMASGLLILAVAAVVSKIFNLVLSRWYRDFSSRIDRIMELDSSSVETKFTIIRKIITAGIYFFAFVFILMQFEAVRNIGTGLLASAGLAGIVIGMAAQTTMSNIIGGIAVSFSQPVRLNDAVIFENEFGWIEEISLMHTVIRTWDNRRIIVPNSVLTNKVIENWTIKDASLLGSVMLYVDYSCDIEKVRAWVREIVDSSPHASEEKLAVVQVVDFTERSMVLRVLSKGPDAGKTWDLRCQIREELIRRFQKEGMPAPQIRIDTCGGNVFLGKEADNKRRQP